MLDETTPAPYTHATPAKHLLATLNIKASEPREETPLPSVKVISPSASLMKKQQLHDQKTQTPADDTLDSSCSGASQSSSEPECPSTIAECDCLSEYCESQDGRGESVISAYPSDLGTLDGCSDSRKKEFDCSEASSAHLDLDSLLVCAEGVEQVTLESSELSANHLLPPGEALAPSDLHLFMNANLNSLLPPSGGQSHLSFAEDDLKEPLGFVHLPPQAQQQNLTHLEADDSDFSAQTSSFCGKLELLGDVPTFVHSGASLHEAAVEAFKCKVGEPCWDELRKPLTDLLLKFYNNEDQGEEFVEALSCVLRILCQWQLFGKINAQNLLNFLID